MDDTGTHSLVCPFLDDDPKYVEFGMLWSRMNTEDGPIEDIFLLPNQDQILLAANRLGWKVTELDSDYYEGWFKCRLEKTQ